MPTIETFIPPAESQIGWFRVEEISPTVGLGVVACRQIPRGIPLNLFPLGFGLRTVDAAEATGFHKSHGIARYLLGRGLYFVVPQFDSAETQNTIEPGWFLNHEDEGPPNVYWDPLVEDGLCVAARQVEAGEELRIDYAYLREPKVHAEQPASGWYYRPLDLIAQYDHAIILAA